MSETKTQLPKNERSIHRELKPDRVYPCGCEEKEIVDPKSGLYMWSDSKRCADHGGNNE